ncbi:MAG: hypothetical protein R3E86_21660 [Pseudomonadales bacterium]
MRTLVLVIALCSLLLAACADPVGGTWRDRSGMTRLRFDADGAVRVEVAGVVHRARYRTHGDRVWIIGSNGRVQLVRRHDLHALVGPLGLVLTRDS